MNLTQRIHLRTYSYVAARVAPQSEDAVARPQCNIGGGLRNPEVAHAFDLARDVGSSHFGIRGDYVFVVSDAGEYPPDGNGLYMIDVSDPENPWIVGDYTVDPSVCHGVALWAHYAIVGTHDQGFAMIDIADPADMQLKGMVGMQRWPGSFVVDGAILFACGSAIGSYELREPLLPEPIAVVGQTGHTRVLASQGSYAYTTRDNGAEFCVIDMSDPEQPELVGIEPMAQAYPGDIALTEGSTRSQYAYVAEGWTHDGFNVVDITDSRAPEHLAFFPLDQSPSDLDVEGDYLYMIAGNLGLMATTSRIQ